MSVRLLLDGFLLRRPLIATWLVVLPLANAQGQAFLHTSATDSVRVVRTELVRVPGQAPGWLIDYADPGGVRDSVALRRRAVAIFLAVRPQLDSLHLTNFVVRAVDEASDSSAVGFQRRLFGFVIQQRADGKWYFLHDSAPIPFTGDPKAP